MTPEDYQRVRFYAMQNFTNREMAVEFGVTPKYVKQVLDGKVDPISSIPAMFPCSGCSRVFTDYSGLNRHYGIWTSGGVKELECWVVMPVASVTA